MSHSVALLMNTLVNFITIYMYMLVIRVLLSWFPNINWLAPPFSILNQLTEPFLKVFRSVIPPLGGTLDISPMLAILLLQLLRGLLSGIARGI